MAESAGARRLRADLMRAAKHAKANPADPAAAAAVDKARELYRVEKAVDLITGQLMQMPLSRANRRRIAEAVIGVEA